MLLQNKDPTFTIRYNKSIHHKSKRT